MASITGTVSAAFTPEHMEAVKNVLGAAEVALREAAAQNGFDGINIIQGVNETPDRRDALSGWLSISLSKTSPRPGP